MTHAIGYPRLMRAHLVQLDIAWEDKQANCDKVERLLSRASPRPGDLVLLPEMFDTGFSFNLEKTADDGGTLAYLKQLAEDLGVYVQGARTVRQPGASHAQNRATVVGPGGVVLADYAKIHPFSYGREQERFEGGRDVVVYQWAASADESSPTPSRSRPAAPGHSVTPSPSLSVCPAICYDLRFPELFRIGLSRGAEMFAIGANWPEARQHHWRTLLIARAIENQAFALGVNRTGKDPNLNYIGGSLAVGPRGEVLGELGNEEGVLSVEIDPEQVRAWREKFPAWRDARLLEGIVRGAATQKPGR